MSESQQGPGPRWIGKQPRQRYNITLDPEIKRKAEAAAAREGLSLSMWLEQAALAKLARKPK